MSSTGDKRAAEVPSTPSSTEKKVDGDLNEREQKLAVIAFMKCLKTGPPEIDIQRFMEHGSFNTMKTASNTWGRIKAKLIAGSGDKNLAQSSDGGTPGTPKTPKAKASPKKRGNAAVDDGDDVHEGSPKFNKRKSKFTAEAEEAVKEEVDE